MLGKGKEAKKPKKDKKPKLTPQQKAEKHKVKVEKAAAAKIRKAEAKVKKAEQAVKNKEKKEENKVKKIAQKEANAVKKLEKKQQKAEEKAEKRAIAKVRKAEIRDEKRARNMQKRAELAARTPLQKKADRQMKIRRLIIVALVIILLSGLCFASVKTAPMVAQKLNIPKFNVAKKIPFLNEKKEKNKKEEDKKAAEEEKKKTDDPTDPAKDKDPVAPEEPKDDKTLNIAGSSVLNDFYTKALGKYLELDKETLKKQSFEKNTEEAYTGLINGDLQVIFSSFPTDKETRMASLAGKTLNPIPILNGGFVFFTNKENSVKNLTETQLYNIYTGTATNWKELGGKDEPIVAYQRSGKSAAQEEMYREVVPEAEIKKVSKDMKKETTEDVIAAVAENSGAIGFAHYYYFEKASSKDSVKMLDVNGIKPNKKNIEKAKYPLTVYSYAIVTMEEGTTDLEGVIKMVDQRLDSKKAATDVVKTDEKAAEGDKAEATPAESSVKKPLKLKFIKWILSEKGQKLAEECGFIRHGDPLPKE